MTDMTHREKIQFVIDELNGLADYIGDASLDETDRQFLISELVDKVEVLSTIRD